MRTLFLLFAEKICVASRRKFFLSSNPGQIPALNFVGLCPSFPTRPPGFENDKFRHLLACACRGCAAQSRFFRTDA